MGDNYKGKKGGSGKKSEAQEFADKIEDLLTDENLAQLGGALKKLVEAGVEGATKTATYIGTQISNSATKLPLIPSSYDQRNRAYLVPAQNPALVDTSPKFIRRGKTSNTWGNLFLIFGTVMGLLSIMSGIAAAESAAIVSGAIVFVTMGAAGLIAKYKGKKGIERGNRFKRYLSDLGDKTVIPVHDLALSVGKPDEFVSQELTQLCLDSTFRQGRLVENGQIFILDNETYAYYKEFKAEESKKQAVATINKPELTPKAQEVLSEGEAHVKTLSTLIGTLTPAAAETTNSLIKTSYLIFDNVQKHPANAQMLDRFTDFYLPTAIKLVQKHAEFQKQNAGGDQTKRALQEIEDSLATLKKGFDQLLDNLNNETARDVRSDISVLNTMLRQEGLLGKDFDMGHNSTSNV